MVIGNVLRQQLVTLFVLLISCLPTDETTDILFIYSFTELYADPTVTKLGLVYCLCCSNWVSNQTKKYEAPMANTTC